jgi:hypothetical protein
LQGKRRLTAATADDGVETAASRRRLGDDGLETTTATSLKMTTVIADGGVETAALR